MIKYIFGIFIFGSLNAQQNVGIGTSTPNVDAVLHLERGTDNKGFLTVPFSEAQRNVFAPNANSDGLLVYQTSDTTGLFYWDATQWVRIVDTTSLSSIIMNYYTSNNIGVPKGVIAQWSGLLTSIPTGWALCDGSNNTPNLTDRFLLSVSTGEDPGAIGGQDSTTLSLANLPIHSHGFSTTTTNTGIHTHMVEVGTAMSGSQGYIQWKFHTGGPLFVQTGEPRGSAEGAHAHAFSGTTTNVGMGQSYYRVPPFYKLAYIIKL